MSGRSLALPQPRRRPGRLVRPLGSHGAAQPGQRAAARLFAVNVLLGAAALAAVAVVLSQLLETWRVDGRAGHAATLLGQRVSYPSANAAAIAVAALAASGLLVVLAGLRGVVRELQAQRRLRRLLSSSGASRFRGVRVIDDERLHAFCAGLVRPGVYISRGAVERLSARELDAVIAHERHHALRRDPLRLAIARVLRDALFFAPVARRLAAEQHSLAEIGADEAAVVAAGGERAPLAAAVLRFVDGGAEGAAGFAPERIDQLVGEGAPWRLPLVLLLICCATLAAVATLGVLAAAAASGSATLAPPLLASRPCVLALASIPAGALVAVLVARSGRRAEHPGRR